MRRCRATVVLLCWLSCWLCLILTPTAVAVGAEDDVGGVGGDVEGDSRKGDVADADRLTPTEELTTPANTTVRNALTCGTWVSFTPRERILHWSGGGTPSGCNVEIGAGSKYKLTGLVQSPSLGPSPPGYVSISGECTADSGEGHIILSAETVDGKPLRARLHLCGGSLGRSGARSQPKCYDSVVGTGVGPLKEVSVGLVWWPDASQGKLDEDAETSSSQMAAFSSVRLGYSVPSLVPPRGGDDGGGGSGSGGGGGGGGGGVVVNDEECAPIKWEVLNDYSVMPCFFQNDGCRTLNYAEEVDFAEILLSRRSGGRSRSLHPLYPAGLTLATQLTATQLPALQRTLSRWSGRLSAAFLSYSDSDSLAIAQLFQSDPSLVQRLDVHLVKAPSPEFVAEAYMRYPVNFMRNVAISNVRTSHVLYAEVNMVPYLAKEREHPGAAKFTRDPLTGVRLPEDDVTLSIAPVFASYDSDYVPDGKAGLVRDLAAKTSRILKIDDDGQKKTDVVRWLMRDHEYRVSCTSSYEAYFMMVSLTSKLMERFVGCGAEAYASWVADLCWDRERFVVSQELFLVRYGELPEEGLGNNDNDDGDDGGGVEYVDKVFRAEWPPACTGPLAYRSEELAAMDMAAWSGSAYPKLMRPARLRGRADANARIADLLGHPWVIGLLVFLIVIVGFILIVLVLLIRQDSRLRKQR